MQKRSVPIRINYYDLHLLFSGCIREVFGKASVSLRDFPKDSRRKSELIPFAARTHPGQKNQALIQIFTFFSQNIFLVAYYQTTN